MKKIEAIIRPEEAHHSEIFAWRGRLLRTECYSRNGDAVDSVALSILDAPGQTITVDMLPKMKLELVVKGFGRGHGR